MEGDDIAVLRAALGDDPTAPTLMRLEERLNRLAKLEEAEAARAERALRDKRVESEARAAALRSGPIHELLRAFFSEKYAAAAPACAEARASGDTAQVNKHVAEAHAAYVAGLAAAMDAHPPAQNLMPLLQYAGEQFAEMRAARDTAARTGTVERRLNAMLGGEPDRKRKRREEDAGDKVQEQRAAADRKGPADPADDFLAFMRTACYPGRNPALPTETMRFNWTRDI